MSLKRYGNKRDKTEQEIVKALRQIGCRVWYLDWPVDLLVCFRQKWYLVEIKSQGGKLTDVQKKLIEEADAPVFVVYSVEEAIKKITGHK